jgi:DNA polymerase elongation subunit (family B)
MLVDTQFLSNTKKLVVSYVDKSGSIKLKYYNMEHPMKYVVCQHNDPDRHPQFKSWDGKSVKQVEVNHPDRYSIYEFLDGLPDEEKEEIFEFNQPKMYFIDIETEIVDGFPEAETTPTRVLSVSVVYDDKIILMGLEEMPEDMQSRIINNTNNYFSKFNSDYKFKYIKFDDEFDMLYYFFNQMVPRMPLLTGWNFLRYDWLYLVNRSRKLTKWVGGKELSIDPSVSSVTKRLNKVWSTDFEIPAHRMIFDYMQLYEVCDTTIKVKESSSLDFVSKKLVGVDKIKFVNSIYKLKYSLQIEGIQFREGDILRRDDGGYYLYSGTERINIDDEEFNSIKEHFREINVTNLQKLYEEDFETYMYYNAVDSVLVQKIHESRNYISIVFAISSLARIKVVDVVSQMNNALGSLAITEGVLRNRFREMDNIVLFKDETRSSSEGEKISGGWVKEPVVGINRWVAIYDFASLYPTTMLQFFISPETFIGIKNPNEDEWCFNEGKRIKLDSEKHVVCINGAVFEKRISPTLRMIEDVYRDRKTNKKKMMSAKEELKSVLDQIKELEESL